MKTELRTLHYFAATCRAENLSLAATSLGIALSTLSQALKEMESDVGEPLFAAVKGGRQPTPVGRAILRAADTLLLTERVARSWLATTPDVPLQSLILDIRLSYTVGGVSQAILRAAEALAAVHPDHFIEPVWSDERDAAYTAGSTGERGPNDAHVVLELETRARDKAGKRTILLADPWVLARRYPAGTQDVPSAIRRGPIVVPRLARALIDQAQRYARDTGLRAIRFLEAHPGDLPTILHEHPDAALFVPRSLISSSLGSFGLQVVATRPSLHTRIVARDTVGSAATTAFVRMLKAALVNPKQYIQERPVLTRREIEYFAATDRLRQISAAAYALGISQPALSERIQKLESNVKTRLFERRGDGVVPTVAGRRFGSVVPLFETGFARLSSGQFAASRTTGHRIVLGVLPSVHQHGFLITRVADALVEVQRRHPDLTLTVQEAPNTVLQDWVMRGSVGIAIVETLLPHMPRVPLSSSEPLAAITHRHHALLSPGPVRLSHLLTQRLVVPTQRSGLRLLLDAAAESRGLTVEPHLEVDALAMTAALLAQLPVCAILPPSAVEREAADGELRVHLITDPTIQRKLFVIYSGERMLSAAERDLIDTLRRKLDKSEQPEKPEKSDKPP